MTVEATPAQHLKRQYPHVSEIKDWRALQTIRLLWDRIFDLEERLQAAQSSIDTLVEHANETDVELEKVKDDAREALSFVTSEQEIEGSEGTGESLPGGGDGGQGQAGLEAAGSTGHIGTVTEFTAFNAGKIVGGVANEFPALLLATAPSENGDTAAIEARRANGEELVRRAIWHLKQAGFNAGRQLNPSGILSNTRLCVEVENENPDFDEETFIREYDIFLAHGVYWEDMSIQMSEGPGAHLVDDDGIAD